MLLSFSDPLVIASLLTAALVFMVAVLRTQRHVARLKEDCVVLLDMVDTDDLTSARSRRYMRSVFEHEAQDGTNAMVFIDLDNFKSVNDGYGHKAGDTLLRAIADALIAAAQDDEIVFRIGGDEFGVYLRGVTLEQATERARALRDVLSGVAISLDGVQVGRTGSIGVARIEAHQDFVGALYYADEAQYAAKTAGGNTVRANAGETLRSMIARRTGPRVEDLTKAVRRNEITYHVQPIFDTRDGCRPIGVEALIRWERADGRLMMPHQFLDVMLGYPAPELRRLFDQARDAAAPFTETEQDLFCSFNISSRFFDTHAVSDDRWGDTLLGDLVPHRTVFEIVEHAVIRDPERTKALLSPLRAQGVRIALDDFGTGLSNLERLQELDVDIVKIDRRFVRGINVDGADLGILRALLDMSRDMQFDIIAEGVETQAELDMLHEIGIWNAQGFLLGRPASAVYWREALNLTPRPTPLLAGQ